MGGWAVVDRAQVADVRFADAPEPETAREPAGLAEDIWSPLPPAPLSARWGSYSAWTGSQFVVWGGYAGGGTSEESTADDGAAYDPVAQRWRRLARAPLQGMYGGTGVWTGRELWLLGGNGDPNGRQTLSAAAAYEPAEDRWRRLPDVPLRVSAAAWSRQTGQAIIAGPDPATGDVAA